MKWLIKWLIKPLIAPVKEAVRLCDKLVISISKLTVIVNGLPLDQEFKDEILGHLATGSTAVTAVRAVLVKVLTYVGEDIPKIDTATIESSIEDVNKSLK
ncbi:MAG: hypothetical protein WC942_09960 [Clostridia bacterium]|jgi:hypothetical protein